MSINDSDFESTSRTYNKTTKKIKIETTRKHVTFTVTFLHPVMLFYQHHHMATPLMVAFSSPHIHNNLVYTYYCDRPAHPFKQTKNTRNDCDCEHTLNRGYTTRAPYFTINHLSKYRFSNVFGEERERDAIHFSNAIHHFRTCTTCVSWMWDSNFNSHLYGIFATLKIELFVI